MGWGARLGFGCNIGAFVGGLASGSLARLGLVRRRAARLLHRHQAPAAVSVSRGSRPMRAVYAVVFVLGFAALLADHLTSPSAGRPVSPEDFSRASRRPAARRAPRCRRNSSTLAATRTLVPGLVRRRDPRILLYRQVVVMSRDRRFAASGMTLSLLMKASGQLHPVPVSPVNSHSKSAIIFSSLFDPVCRTCLAQLRVSSRGII